MHFIIFDVHTLLIQWKINWIINIAKWHFLFRRLPSPRSSSPPLYFCSQSRTENIRQCSRLLLTVSRDSQIRYLIQGHWQDVSLKHWPSARRETLLL